ncbi:hypothetical protein BGZ82_011305 [Podila clonocystis]|nr:hypothetical protein BGZ82_011305 [Podila clonocystis]
MSARLLTLTIHHICDSIVDHLSSNDVHNCITVSKEFHQAFVPYQWRFIHISKRSSYTSLRDNIRASEGRTLIENRPRIIALSSVYSEIWDLFLQTDAPAHWDATDPISNYVPRASFANLTSLHALSSPEQYAAPCINPDYTYGLHSVIENSPRLRELKIIYHSRTTSMQLVQLSRIIRGHSSLKSLSLETVEMHLGQYKELLWSCWNLEKLDIATCFYNHPKLPAEAYQTDDQEQELDMWLAENRPHIYAAALAGDNRSNSKDDGKVLFQLKEFYFYTRRYRDDFGITFPFLRRCRGLIRFRPPRIESTDLLHAIEAEIPDCWPDMEHLDLSNSNPHRRDSDAGLLLAFASPKSRHGGLTSLTLEPYHVSPYNVALSTIQRRHGSTLVNLDLRGCHGMSGRSLHMMLTSCHNLRSFLALTDAMHYLTPGHKGFYNFKGDPVLQSLDLEYADSWKCLGLETLHLQFRNGGMSCAEDKCNRAGIPRAIFYQIQELNRLRDLKLCLVPPTWEDSGESKNSRYMDEWRSLVKMWGSRNVSDALNAFGKLEDLETLELRGLKDYIQLNALNAVTANWPKLNLVTYS